MGDDSGKNDISWPTEIIDEMTIESDSRIWKEFEFRQDDIVAGSYHKAGTTVTQQIISQLIFNGKEDVPIWQVSPWLEFRLAPKEQTLAILKAQTHRRFIKTHLPATALPIIPEVKYIYVARDGRDVAWSFHHHLSNVFDEFNQAQWKLYDPEARIMPAYPLIPESPYQFYLEWLRDDGFPHGSFFENIKSWWSIKHLPNVLLVHYSNILDDLSGEIIKMATFLEMDIQTLKMEDILQHCSFQYMKTHSATYAPVGGKPFKGGSGSFFYKGTNRRWEEVLSAEEVKQYEKKAEERLGPECAHWLATGKEK
ncbi:MAG: sulfotransferase domain-containing protein [Pseudomonadota bacterium]